MVVMLDVASNPNFPETTGAQLALHPPPTPFPWAMARAAGNDFGTNVVHLYGDLAKNGRGVAVKNPYSSGIKQAESARGEPDFSGDREEDVDYWDEDEHPAEEA